MSCCDDKTQQGKQKSGLNGFLTGSRGLMLLGGVAVAGGLAFARHCAYSIEPIAMSHYVRIRPMHDEVQRQKR